MQLREAIRRRRMTRRFDPDRPVPDGAIREALEHAVRAPSAGFSQGWDFVLLEQPADRNTFWAASTDPDPAENAWLSGVRAAPVLVVCCSCPQVYLDRYAEPDKGWTDRDPARWPVPYWDVDVGMAALLILLTAVEHGLGGLFFGVPATRHDAVRRALGIPDNRRLVGVVALGYSLPGPRSPSLARGRREFQQVVHQGRFRADSRSAVPRSRGVSEATEASAGTSR